MRLFTRTVLTSGPPAEVLAFSTDMRAFVSDTLGIDIGLWTVSFGAPLGTLVYSARVEGVGHLATINETLMSNPAYHEKLAAGAAFSAGAAEDAVMTPLHGGVGDPPPVGSVVVATRAVVAGGKYAEAVAWGIDVAVHGEQVTGFPVGFYMSDFGVFGSVGWLSAAPDAAAAEAAGDKLNADPAYIEKLGSVGDLFVPASGMRTMATRVA